MIQFKFLTHRALQTANEVEGSKLFGLKHYVRTLGPSSDTPVVEMGMLRWSCGVSRMYRVRNKVIVIDSLVE